MASGPSAGAGSLAMRLIQHERIGREILKRAIHCAGSLLAFPAMDPKVVIDGLIMYLGLLVLLTFHEFGHAWMAWKCGDDTARLQGRVSLNPLVHIDPIGTVVMPLLMIFLSTSGSGLGNFLIGWAKPVPVNPNNLRN